MKHRGYHWHEGEGHSHEHEDGHHGPAFGKKSTIFVGETKEPDLSFLLKKSIEQAKEVKRDK
jgi:hypothetical protein